MKVAQSESRHKDVSIFLLPPSKARSDILNITALIRDLQMNENALGSCQTRRSHVIDRLVHLVQWWMSIGDRKEDFTKQNFGEALTCAASVDSFDW